jgi:hypothetical protein
MSGARPPCLLRPTAPLVYLRLHGPDPDLLYAGSYPRDSLAWWADRVRDWTGQSREVSVDLDGALVTPGSTRTSTTTAAGTPSATPPPCGNCSTDDSVPLASVVSLLCAVDRNQVSYGPAAFGEREERRLSDRRSLTAARMAPYCAGGTRMRFVAHAV